MLLQNERYDFLLKEKLEIIQNDDVFSFSTDALLLAHFTKIKKKDVIMDLCSGNGVIPLLLSHKGNQFIEGIEIQEQLVHMAKRSIVHNHLTDRIHMYHMDLKQAHHTFIPAQYSLVTCNPPYFKVNHQFQHQKDAHKIARH